MKKILLYIWEIVKVVVIALVIVVPIRYFLFQPFFVKGASMEPNFENGNYLIVDELSYRLRSPERGEVIVFKYPKDPSQRFIKRVIGLPGETVEIKDSRVLVKKGDNVIALNESNYLSEKVLTSGDISIFLGEKQYFVLGDNRSFSYDSRGFGVLPFSNIIGRVLFRAWPVNNIRLFKAPAY